MQLPIRKFSLYALSLIVLTGCLKSNEPDKPHLVAPAELLKKNSLLGGLASVINSIPVTGVAGSEMVCGQDGFINDGKAFDALKVVVSGKPFTDGTLGPPKGCIVESRGSGSTDKASGTFWEATPGVYSAIIPVRCKGAMDVELKIPCLKEGDGEFEVDVGPKEEPSCALHFKHSFEVVRRGGFTRMLRDAMEEGRSARRQLDQDNSEDKSKEDNQPKTQYELQQQMLKDQQRNNSNY